MRSFSQRVVDAHPVKHGQNARARGVDADAAAERFAAQRAERHEVGGAGNVCRNGDVRRVQSAAAHRDGTAVRTDIRAHRREHALGMVAREERFAHGRLPFRTQSREDERALDLRAGDVRIHRAAVKARGAHRDGSVPLRRRDVRAQKAQGRRDPLHRAAGEGSVPRQARFHAHARHEPHEQAHGRAAVAAVAVGGTQPLGAAHADAAPFHLDLRAQSAHTGDGRETVRAQKRVRDDRLARRDAVEQDRAVGDRFIAGDLEIAGKETAGSYLHARSSARMFKYRA